MPTRHDAAGTHINDSVDVDFIGLLLRLVVGAWIVVSNDEKKLANTANQPSRTASGCRYTQKKKNKN